MYWPEQVGQYLYETYVEADYEEFLQDLGSRIGDTGVWPQHTAGLSLSLSLSLSLIHFLAHSFGLGRSLSRLVVPESDSFSRSLLSRSLRPLYPQQQLAQVC